MFAAPTAPSKSTSKAAHLRFAALVLALAGGASYVGDAHAGERSKDKAGRDLGMFDVSAYNSAFPSSNISIRVADRSRGSDATELTLEDSYSMVGNTADVVTAKRVEKRGSRIFLSH